MPLTAMEAQTADAPWSRSRSADCRTSSQHHGTGYLAPAGDADALAVGLVEAISDARGDDVWGRAARERAVATWSGPVVVRQYLDVYAQATR